MHAARTPPSDPTFKAQCAEAARQGGGWVYEIDAMQVQDANGAVPPRAIIGAWEVGREGQVTGAFKANPNYRPVNPAT
jgi:hypothetical protein